MAISGYYYYSGIDYSSKDDITALISVPSKYPYLEAVNYFREELFI